MRKNTETRFLLMALTLGLAGGCNNTGPELQEHLDASANLKVDMLIKKLGDDEFEIREEAQDRLTKLGPDIGLRLYETLQSSQDPEIRLRLRRILADVSRHAASVADVLFSPYGGSVVDSSPLLVVLFDDQLELEMALNLMEGTTSPHADPIDFSRFRYLDVFPTYTTLDPTDPTTEFLPSIREYSTRFNWHSKVVEVNVVLNGTRPKGVKGMPALLLRRLDDFGVGVTASYDERTQKLLRLDHDTKPIVAFTSQAGSKAKRRALTEDNLIELLDLGMRARDTLLLREIAKSYGKWEKVSEREAIERLLSFPDPLVHFWLFRSLMSTESTVGIQKIRRHLSTLKGDTLILEGLSILSAYDAVVRFANTPTEFLLDVELYEKLYKKPGEYWRTWLPFFIAKGLGQDLPSVFQRVSALKKYTNESAMLMDIAACSKDRRGIDALFELLDNPQEKLREEALWLIKKRLATTAESLEEIKSWWRSNRSKVIWKDVRFGKLEPQ